MNCGYGIVAEADFGSERIRWLGSLRPSIWAFYRILCGSLYRARITYLSTDQPRQAWHGVKCGRECQLCRTALRRIDKETAEDFIIDGASPSPPASPSQESHSALPPQQQPATAAAATAATADVPAQQSPKGKQAEEGSGNSDFSVDVVEVDGGQQNTATTTTTSTMAVAMPRKAVNGPAVYGPSFTTSLSQTDNWADGVPTQFARLFSSYPHYKIGEAVPPGWAVHDNLSISFCTFQKLPWLMPGMYVAPFAHLSDGCMDVCYASAEAFSRISFIKFFSTFPEGGHVNSPKLSYFKVKSFTVEPLDNDGYIGIDGERVKFAPTQFHVAQGLLNFLVYC